ncbi:MAG: hypothetical protein AVDCRST_MAG68-3389, partial [uncultured Gemmatimonadetes bacterium]
GEGLAPRSRAPGGRVPVRAAENGERRDPVPANAEEVLRLVVRTRHSRRGVRTGAAFDGEISPYPVATGRRVGGRPASRGTYLHRAGGVPPPCPPRDSRTRPGSRRAGRSL